MCGSGTNRVSVSDGKSANNLVLPWLFVYLHMLTDEDIDSFFPPKFPHASWYYHDRTTTLIISKFPDCFTWAEGGVNGLFWRAD